MSHPDTPSSRKIPGARLKRTAPRLQVLEQRMMFDGAAVVDAAAQTAAAEAAAQSAQAAPDHGASDVPAAPAAVPTDAERPDASTGSPASHEIVFIDRSMPDALNLAAQVKSGAQVVLVDSGHDGLLQVDAALQGRNDVTAIHIVSHGTQGRFQLGTSQLDADSLQSQSALLREIGSHLAAGGDVLLYGCDVGSGDAGRQFLQQLAVATQADIAASTDATGASVLGGNWTLEASVGAVQAQALQFVDGDRPFVLGTPAVASVDDTTWTEGSGAVVVDGDITITGGGSYDGKYVRFSVTNGQATDALAIRNAANVNAVGAISAVGSAVYLGNGTGRDVIGSIDATENGQGGRALKVNFVSTFTNSSFETGTLAGWTSMNQVIDLGSTVIAGFVSPQDTTYPANSGGNDNDYPTTPGSYSTPIVTDQKTDGNFALRLLSQSMTTRYGYDVVHGPAVYSDVFSASAGDAIYFDWRALAGDDAFDVYGYILNTTTGATTKVLDVTGSNTSSSTAWATASASIPTAGNYRFVFVSGTYDYSGGRAAGASLYIDNVRVYGSKVNDAVVSNIARSVTFEALSDSPVTAQTRVFTVTAVEANGLVGSDTGLINVVATNDAPVLGGTAATTTYTENAAATVVDAQVTVSDPDGPASFNGGWFQAQVTGNGAAEDRLSVVNAGTAVGQIGISGSNVTWGGTVIGTLDATLTGNGTGALRINLNANATAAAVQALARDIAYANTSDTPSTAARTVSFTLNDGGNVGAGGALQGSRTATVNVVAVDDPAVLATTRGTASYLENDNGFYVDAGLTITDVDSTTLSGAKVVISTNYRNGEDRLAGPGAGVASGTRTTYTYNGAGGEAITLAFDSLTGVMTLAGTASIANYEAALRSVRYVNDSDNPSTAARDINITLGNAVMLNFGGKNHYYEFVAAQAITWTNAKTAAESRVFQGMTGYLATATSQAENDYIRDKLQSNAWIGGSDDYLYLNAALGATVYANQAAAEGHWYWVGGPEKGMKISDGNSPSSVVTPSGGYSNWVSPGEPNNAGGSEHYAEIYANGAVGYWNDLPNNSTGLGIHEVQGYVVEYNDNGGTPVFSKTVSVTPVRVNDAPVVSGASTLAGITEDALNNSGAAVGSFLAGATDADGTAVAGIAVTGLASSRGSWQYSTDGGATWAAVGAVSDASALLLRSADRVRFLPDGQNADTASLTYRAWDRSDEGGSRLAGSKAGVAGNGGTTAYSAGTQTASIAVSAVNDAPVLTPGAPALATLDEDVASPAGTVIGTLLGGTVADVDAGSTSGVAITGLASGNGTWEYSTNGGTSWTAVGAVSTGGALLLGATDQIRFRPDGRNGTSASFSYKAWDQSSGARGTKVDASAGGGTSAFSVASDRAGVTVTSVNDAPVLAGTALTFSPISEKDTGNAGQTVNSLLGTTFSDVDAGTQAGVAVVGSTAQAGNGSWAYSTDGGATWQALGAVSGSQAVLLRGTDRVRFTPDSYEGGSATLTLRGWDGSSGSAGGTADTTANSGTTAFSAATQTAGITITPVNDAPVFVMPATGAAFTEGGPAAAVGTGLVLKDDGGMLSSVRVRIAGGFVPGDTLAIGAGDRGGLSLAYNAGTGVLTLTGSASVATYQSALRALTFASSSDDPTLNGNSRSLEWTATDTTNLTSAVSTTSFGVVATADAPVIAGTPSAWQYVEDDGTRTVAPSLTLNDRDDTQLSGARVILEGDGYMNDGRETLGFTTTGTGITGSWDASTGVLTFTGTASVADYQRVLRSVTYTNTADYDHPGAGASVDLVDGPTRTLTWEITDANSDGAHGSPAFVAQSGTQSTAITLVNANETPQVDNVSGNVTHIPYVENGSPATLEGVLSVLDDSGAQNASAAISEGFVRVTAGLAQGDELGFFDTAALGAAGWTQSGSALQGTLAKGGVLIDYAYSADDGNLHLTTAAGSAASVAGDYSEVMQRVGFRSTSDDPTALAPTRTLIWRVTDSLGEQSAVTAAQSTIIDIEAVNDAATVAGLPATGDIVYLERDADVAVAPSLALTDPDDTDLTGATVTLSGAGFAAAHEYLALPGIAAGPSYDWTDANALGSGIAASYDHATGTLTLTGAATRAAYEALLRQVRYGSDDRDPTATASTRTVTWQVTDVFGSRSTDVPAGNDGDAGNPSAPVTSTITLLPRNDAPVVGGGGTRDGYTEGGAAALPATGLVLSDADDTELASARVQIRGGYTAGDQLSLGDAHGLSTSYDASTGVLTVTGTASLADYQAALRTLRFSSTSADPTAIAPTRTLSIEVTDADASADGAQASTVVTVGVDLTAVDTAATLGGLPADHAITYVENGSAVAIAPALVLADADDTQLVSATVAIAGGFATGDVLAIAGGAASFGLAGSYDAATGVLTLAGPAPLADFQAALRAVTYAHTGDDPTATGPTRTFSWSTTSAFASRGTDAVAGNDGDGGTASAPVSRTQDIAARNDAPTLALSNGPAVNGHAVPVFQQGSAPVAALHVDGSAGGVSLADPDSADRIAGATVVISADHLVSDVLAVGTPAGWTRTGNVLAGAGVSIAVAYDAATGTLTLTGIGSRAAYETLLGQVTYANGSVAPTASSASRELTWTVTDSNSAGDPAGARSTSGTSALVIVDLNDSPTVSPAALSAAYTEGDGPVSLAGFTVTDPDPGELVTATLTLSNPAAGVLTTAGTDATYDPATGVWTLSGPVATINAALAAVAFVPAPDNDLPVTVALHVADGGEDGAQPADATFTLNVTAVNDAPVLTAVAPVLAPLSEDDVANAGVTVGSLRGPITDVDSGTQPGIAITGADPGNGHWEYQLAGSGSWQAVGAVNASGALLLADADKVRFVPNGENATQATFTYRAWDGTGASHGARLDASSTGNATPFSNLADVASITVQPVNDRPVLSAAAPALTTIDEDNTSAGTPVSALVAGSISDVDQDALGGIAITSTSSGNGLWQYSLDGGTTWTAVGAVGAGSARLLRDSDLLRFVPNGQNGTTGSIGYVAWDRTSGSAGILADTTVGGPTGAYSIGGNTASITVSAVNDAPLLAADTPQLAGIDENASGNGGQTVASFVGATLSDVDAGALPGIAITGSTDGNGRWQYSLDDGANWTDMGPLSSTQSLLLRTSDRIRFVPDTLNGTSGSLTYRAWDQTAGAAGGTADTRVNGDTTAFSVDQNTATLVVAPVNDAPVLSADAPSLPTLDEDQLDNGGLPVATLVGSTIGDVDSGAVQGIAITSSGDGNGRWQYSLDGGTSWTDVGPVSDGSARLLRATDLLRFRPNAENATTGTLGYRAWDRSAGTAGDLADTTANGGDTPYSAQSNTAGVTVTAVNDLPLNDVPPSVTGAERVDGSVRQDAVLTADPGQWHDVDAGHPPLTYTYQWEVADDAAGTNLRNLTGEEAARLDLTADHVGKWVRVRVVAHDEHAEAPSAPAYSAFQHVTNVDPVADVALQSPRSTEAVPYSYTLPAGAFRDANGEDTLRYTAKLENGDPLPAWLAFDPATRTFSGTPTGKDIGIWTVVVTADDRGGHPVSVGFEIAVAGVPLPETGGPAPQPAAAPPVTTPVEVSTPASQVAAGAPGIATAETFSPAGNGGAFAGGPLTDGPAASAPVRSLEAALGLPAAPGLSAPADRGSAPTGDAGRSTGTGPRAGTGDFSSGYTRAEGFQILVPKVSGEQATLTVNNLPDTAVRNADQPLQVQLPPDTFVHTRTDAVVNLAATQAGGGALPSWLRFDAQRGQFSGTPPAGFEGEVEVTVLARDNFGNTASVLVKIRVGKGERVKADLGKPGLSAQLRAEGGGTPRHAVQRTLLEQARAALRAATTGKA